MIESDEKVQVSDLANDVLNQFRSHFPDLTDGEIAVIAADLKKRRETQITQTKPEDLILSNEETNKYIERLREIVATDPYFVRFRKGIAEETGTPIIMKNGEPCVVIYRGTAKGNDIATTASGFCEGRGTLGRAEKINSLKNIADVMDDYSFSDQNIYDDSHPGKRLFTKLCGNHMVEADGSPLVPATADPAYANSFYRGDNLVIEMTVPLKHIVPIFQYANMYITRFSDEKELAIAGRVEPEWCKVLSSEELEKAKQDYEDRLEKERLKRIESYQTPTEPSLRRSPFAKVKPNPKPDDVTQ